MQALQGTCRLLSYGSFTAGAGCTADPGTNVIALALRSGVSARLERLPGSPVVVPPCEALSDQLLGGEALHQLNDLEVGDSGDLGMLLQVEILLRIEDTLCKGHTLDRYYAYV